MLTTENRVLAYAESVRARIATGKKPDGSPMGDLARLDRGMALTTAEWVAYQNAQARAHATGKLTASEAQTVYIALGGEVPSATGWAEGVDLAMKITITRLIGELAGVRS